MKFIIIYYYTTLYDKRTYFNNSYYFFFFQKFNNYQKIDYMALIIEGLVCSISHNTYLYCFPRKIIIP